MHREAGDASILKMEIRTNFEEPPAAIFGIPPRAQVAGVPMDAMRRHLLSREVPLSEIDYLGTEEIKRTLNFVVKKGYW